MCGRGKWPSNPEITLSARRQPDSSFSIHMVLDADPFFCHASRSSTSTLPWHTPPSPPSAPILPPSLPLLSLLRLTSPLPRHHQTFEGICKVTRSMLATPHMPMEWNSPRIRPPPCMLPRHPPPPLPPHPTPFRSAPLPPGPASSLRSHPARSAGCPVPALAPPGLSSQPAERMTRCGVLHDLPGPRALARSASRGCDPHFARDRGGTREAFMGSGHGA
jgi:hypothetical protein